MKQTRNRIIYVIILIWGFLGTMIQFDKIKQLIITDAGVEPVTIQAKISIIWVFLFITFALTILFIYKKKSGDSWKTFLFEEIDQLNEDERSILIDAPARRFAGNILVMTMLIYLFALMMGPLSVQSSTILYAIAILFTVYELSYYFKLKQLYYR
ncbi:MULTISPECIES: hypothetical protein [Erysipelothrix]|uniref:DUF2178 domain-containing protein n=1 Tax=Erysipelothrix piscisicarius TaxID=2485784 RepID=A0A3S8RMH7_9FIRM|nr:MULTISPECIES: hypothetical protein [Erysipelothrix]AZK44097.1 hypothetical protein EEI45_04395 [Erysipelothrix piscisicarius]MBK2402770.1 hypothetical protein [Erysipelothrix sp. strain 2 (EsS2-6-Brazil)]MBK2404139.1 hypothetical protein [Erysipelothrix sp. strain 2 (EsS2-7-Brazil)]NBA01736.1 hypothetical protein [Erysipelothrix rhusiopathiae]